MYKFGLKVWSTNKNYFQDIISLYKRNFYQYIELFVVPNSYEKFISLWKVLDIPFVIHAPHFSVGMNLAKKEKLEGNLRLAEETFMFAKDLNAKFVIFHPGIDGDTQETVFQLNKIKQSYPGFSKKILIENKPYYALVNDLVCNGNSPEEIEFIKKEAGVGFCLDIGHAIYSANVKKKDPFEYLDVFNELMPKLYHFYDGDFQSVYDVHKHFGDGSFQIKKILEKIPNESFISIETPKEYQDSLDDFKQDIYFLTLDKS